MRKLVIITSGLLSQRQIKQFGMEKLDKKFDIKILDFTLFYRPDYLTSKWDKYYKKNNPKDSEETGLVQWDKYYLIKSKDDLLKIEFGDEKLFLLDLSFPNNSPIFIWARKFFKKKKCITINYFVGLVPEQSIVSSRNFLDLFRHPKKTIFKIINFIKRFFYKQISTRDIALYGGLFRYNTTKAKHKVKAHGGDYDIYLKLKNEHPIKKEPYVVFLDENYVWHPDQRVFEKLPLEMSPESYFKRLSIFFKKFEVETKLKIKFAAHPVSDPKKLDNLKKEYNFDILHGNTPDLVKNCTAVLMHRSTSVSFAVLFEKPIIYLYLKEFDYFEMGNQIKKLKNLLGGELIEVDYNKKKIDINNLIKINKSKYNKYLDTYIRFPGSPDKELVDILIDFINKNYTENQK